jgi:hypothetical protein
MPAEPVLPQPQAGLPLASAQSAQTLLLQTRPLFDFRLWEVILGVWGEYLAVQRVYGMWGK